MDKCIYIYHMGVFISMNWTPSYFTIYLYFTFSYYYIVYCICWFALERPWPKKNVIDYVYMYNITSYMYMCVCLRSASCWWEAVSLPPLPGATTFDALEPAHQSWGASGLLRQGRRPKVRYDVWLKTFGRPEFALSSSLTSPISPIDQWFQTMFFPWSRWPKGRRSLRPPVGWRRKAPKPWVAGSGWLQHPQF